MSLFVEQRAKQTTHHRDNTQQRQHKTDNRLLPELSNTSHAAVLSVAQTEFSLHMIYSSNVNVPWAVLHSEQQTGVHHHSSSNSTMLVMLAKSQILQGRHSQSYNGSLAATRDYLFTSRYNGMLYLKCRSNLGVVANSHLYRTMSFVPDIW